MTVMEEKLFAALWSHAGDEELMAAREQAERELAPYRGKMSASADRTVSAPIWQ